MVKDYTFRNDLDLRKFTKHVQKTDGKKETRYYYENIDGYLLEPEYNTFLTQDDINDFRITEIGSEYTTILYPNNQDVKIMNDLLVAKVNKEKFKDLHYLVESFSSFADMQDFINNRINEGFVIKETVISDKTVEMTRKIVVTPPKTEVKD